MKLQFKEQDFQLQAVKAVIDCFTGQPMKELFGKNKPAGKKEMTEGMEYRNNSVSLTEQQVLQNIQKVQQGNKLAISRDLERPAAATSGYHLTIEMETGTGKTYTYIHTMYELQKQYGWSKFIIIVPSIAIREGVFKSFEVTKDHFRELYGHTINPFIYNSNHPQDIENFAKENSLGVMIINTQAFNASSTETRRIYQELDQFGSRRPIDIMAQTNPILIIDEPQSVDGGKTLLAMQDFNPLFALRYSATHKVDYNKIFRLDALDAYHKKLVKKIQVKGINLKAASGASGYLYAEEIILSTDKPPYAIIEFEKKTINGVKRVRQKLSEGTDLYELSGHLPAYKNQTIIRIDGYQQKIVIGGQDIYPGDIINDSNEHSFRRIQIRECILSHLQKEQQLLHKGIKVLSLFFIDSVDKYRLYTKEGEQALGEYAIMFEEEYNQLRNDFLANTDHTLINYISYLKRDNVRNVHRGYFSIDKKGRSVNPIMKRGSEESDDSAAYDLIMKDKERLLSFEEPARFIFSHSALKEGWDNPNVFQICALKNITEGSQARRRQEVGRGMRLCVNKNGYRLDEEALGDEVHEINRLTVIASESYEAFAKGLQSEIAAALKDRHKETARHHIKESFKPDNERQIIIRKPGVHLKKAGPEAMEKVSFDTKTLIYDCKTKINKQLTIIERIYEVKMAEISFDEKKQLIKGSEQSFSEKNHIPANVVYDVIGEIEALTYLTRATIVSILKSIKPDKFLLLHQNPEEFVIHCSRLINEARNSLIMENIGGTNDTARIMRTIDTEII